MEKIRLLVRKLLRETIMNEAKLSQHFIDRLKERLTGTNGVPVGYEGTKYTYEIVGTYIIPQNYIDEVLQKVQFTLKANFPSKKSYGIKVVQIPIIPTQIQFESNHNINTIKGKNLLFVSQGDESNGNILYFVIRNNEFYTFMFMKNYVQIDTNKLRVDHVLSNWDIIQSNQVR